MRGFLASSIGVTCAAALALPLTLASPGSATAARPAADSLPGRTQSLPLGPLAPDDRAGGTAAPGERGLARRDVRPFSLVGVVWDDPDAELRGRVQVRTRATGTGTGTWSPWQEVETHNHEHAADPDTPERDSGGVRGSTAPLWVGDSDGVEVRVRPDAGRAQTRADEDDPSEDELPEDELPEDELPEDELPEDELPEDELPEDEFSEDGPSGGELSERESSERESSEESEEEPSEESQEESEEEPSEESEEEPSEESQEEPSEEETSSLPAGLRLELVDPGEDPTPPADAPSDGVDQAAQSDAAVQGTPVLPADARTHLMPAEAAASAVNAELAPLGATVIPALDKAATEADLLAALDTDAARAKPYIGPRPAIVTRRGWGADESLRERNFVYTKTVKVAFVHHSATGNNYRCSQAPSVLRSIYRYHVKSSGWRDIGYNFAVDKCGNIYEGRAGGVAKAVLGAHTLGFNSNSMGVAVLGSFTNVTPPKAAVTGVAKLTAWKLGLFGANPRGTTYLKSGGGNLYKKGSNVKLNVISGHRDGFRTECPGRRLYEKLGTARSASARYQGR